ncbi:HTH domain-containing protein [Bacteroidales bacterium OttesenSCG-928-C19]|nr:HTH domain-containing protein [Bacteroidales bacterium OttesenSCG-928-C19]
MSLIDDRLKLERLDQLIRLKATGSPEELADKMNTSKRTIFRTINDLKEIGCPIYFDKQKNSYCYQHPGKLMIKFEVIDDKQLSQITGGKNYAFSHSDNIWHLPVIPLPRKTNRFCFIREMANTYF